MVEPGEDGEVIAKALERLQNRRELEPGTLLGRRPVVHHRAVRHIHDAQAGLERGRGLAQRRERRHHTVQQRQRDGCPETAEHGTPGDGFLGDDHDSDLLI